MARLKQADETRSAPKLNLNIRSERLKNSEIIFESRTKKATLPDKSRPDILKVYLKNTTLKSGDLALLKCPSVFDRNNREDMDQQTNFKSNLQGASRNKYNELNVDEYFAIKTVSKIFFCSTFTNGFNNKKGQHHDFFSNPLINCENLTKIKLISECLLLNGYIYES